MLLLWAGLVALPLSLTLLILLLLVLGGPLLPLWCMWRITGRLLVWLVCTCTLPLLLGLLQVCSAGVVPVGVRLLLVVAACCLLGLLPWP